MRNKILIGLTILGLMVFMTGLAAATTTIVNTGTQDFSSAEPLSSVVWLAGQFQTDRAYSLTSVAGWMGNSTGNVTAVIRGNSAGLPGAVLYSGSFAASSGYGWQGVSGMTNWNLAAGTYWVAFEVQNDSTFNGSMPENATNPLAQYAFANVGNSGQDYEYESLNGGRLAVKIEGSPVPLPGALLLFGPGLVACGLLRRRLTT